MLRLGGRESLEEMSKGQLLEPDCLQSGAAPVLQDSVLSGTVTELVPVWERLWCPFPRRSPYCGSGAWSIATTGEAGPGVE